MATGKRFYWMKLKESFMTSDTIDYFMSQPNGANYVVLYQMLCLKTINTAGRLERQIGEIIIPYDVDKIQRDCKWFSADTVRVALTLYRQVGLVYEDVDGTLVMADHDNLVGSETDAAARMRSSRANRNAAIPPPVTNGEQGANIVTPDNRDRDKSLDIRNKNSDTKDKGKKADAFSELAGANPELLDALIDFERMRKSIKKPMTDRAKRMLASKLEKEFHPSIWIAVLEQSITHCWQDIYPLKSGEEAPRRMGYGKKTVPMGASGELGEAELEAIRKQLEADYGDQI